MRRQILKQGTAHADGNQVLILGQPWDYPRLLAEAPDWFHDAYRIGLWVWELDQFPGDWKFALDIVHEIWTPSSFSANALRRGTELPIRVVPHAVDRPEVSPLSRAEFGVRGDQFLGLAIMDLAACPDRKNPLAHVRAWSLAFGNDMSCHLLMKVRFKKNTTFARRELLREIGKARNITLVEQVFSDRDMAAFQRMADVYLSLHRAEGYGLNIHEMLELGVPTLATAWSGNMDYMGRYPHSVPVPYELVPYKDRTFAYQGADLAWAEPDIKFSARALREIRARWQEERASTTASRDPIARPRNIMPGSGTTSPNTNEALPA
ncbi:glycosyltransferase [Hyphomicrobium sp. ghe19]|uniref:glycosyltransferase n=1 Tax=Hyphomicrobium sp. ghe19 TaxID=2682968 RepID=UPI0030CB890D